MRPSAQPDGLEKSTTWVAYKRKRSTDNDNLPASPDNSSVVVAVWPITVLLLIDMLAMLYT